MKKVLIVLLVLISTPIAIYSYFVAQSYFQGQDLSADSSDIKTVYRFRFSPDREVVIRDLYSKINRSWGGSANSIFTNYGMRTVIFTESAILKTDVDSIEPHSDYVHVKGYMGVYVQDLNFTVDKDGIISSDSWHGG